jgi:hypothetical protein
VGGADAKRFTLKKGNKLTFKATAFKAQSNTYHVKIKAFQELRRRNISRGNTKYPIVIKIFGYYGYSEGFFSRLIALGGFDINTISGITSGFILATTTVEVNNVDDDVVPVKGLVIITADVFYTPENTSKPLGICTTHNTKLCYHIFEYICIALVSDKRDHLVCVFRRRNISRGNTCKRTCYYHG